MPCSVTAYSHRWNKQQPLPMSPSYAGWIARQQADGQAPCSPLTGAPLPHLMLTPNHALRKLVAGFAASGLLGN